jgi:hypothetical protein
MQPFISVPVFSLTAMLKLENVSPVVYYVQKNGGFLTNPVGEVGFEPTMNNSTDLQSAALNHSATLPRGGKLYLFPIHFNLALLAMRTGKSGRRGAEEGDRTLYHCLGKAILYQ